MMTFLQCLFSPRLIKIYTDGARDVKYQPLALERWGDKVITMASTIMNIGWYTSPFICMYVYSKGFYTLEQTRFMAMFLTGVGCIISMSYVIRGYGRSINPKYMQFLNTYNNAIIKPKVYINVLRNYDFEFDSWPVTYNASSVESLSRITVPPICSANVNTDLPGYQHTFVCLLGYMATHSFGLRMIYPGSMGIINYLMGENLYLGRTRLVAEFNAQRTKIATADSNFLDTMFVDNRRRTPEGSILVVCSEGNSGFYEIGIMFTPLQAGFSVLGWNHPGFGGSTGKPYPDQERYAMDAVMQYAVKELKFEPENIVLFGWSIGGYTSTWAACHYPVKALILDATFDDLLPLALNQMPASWSPLVKEVVKSYVDLDIATMIKCYNGPLKLIRRTEDEIICLRQNDMSTNRINNLLMKVVSYRYPDIAEEELCMAKLEKYVALPEKQRANIAKTDISSDDKELLFLISKYLSEFDTTHCMPLSVSRFVAVMADLCDGPGGANTSSKDPMGKKDA